MMFEWTDVYRNVTEEAYTTLTDISSQYPYEYNHINSVWKSETKLIRRLY